MGKKSQQKKLARASKALNADQNKITKSGAGKLSGQFKIKNGFIRIILVAVVFLLYGNTVNYEFTVDDNSFYQKHSTVQKGLSGFAETFTYGSLEKYNGMKGVQPYRPVTLISFAIQKQLFNNDPGKAHLVNVLLYALVVLVLFNVLLKLLPSVNSLICGIIVLLFAVHPVHTEVVASVKSQDELLAALFALLSLSFSISLIKAEKYSLKYGSLSFIFFSLALLSKESAFAMLLIFPLTFWILFSQSIRRSLLYSIPFVVAATIFLFVRHLVFAGEVQNYQNTVLENVLLNANGFAQSTATKMEILFQYLRLVFLPWPLSWDYSYNQIPVVNWSSFIAWLSLFLYGGLLIFVVLKIKKKPVISFGILFYLIMLTPTANLFFLNGSTLAERFLFLPSLGLIIAAVFIVAEIFKINLQNYSGNARGRFNFIFIAIIILFAILSFVRSSDWQSNLSVFKAGVENASNSSRTNAALGIEYRKMGEAEKNLQRRSDYFSNAIKYTKASLVILPSNKDALYNLGVSYFNSGDSANAIESYKNLIHFYPDHRSALNNLGTIFLQENKFDSAYTYLKRCYDVDSTYPKSSQNLAIYYFNLADYNKTIRFAQNAIRLNKYLLLSYEIISRSYKALGNETEAAKYQKLYHEMAAESSEAPDNTRVAD